MLFTNRSPLAKLFYCLCAFTDPHRGVLLLNLRIDSFDRLKMSCQTGILLKDLFIVPNPSAGPNLNIVVMVVR